MSLLPGKIATDWFLHFLILNAHYLSIHSRARNSSVNGKTSVPRAVSCSVAQGSVLSPLLSYINVDGLANIQLSEGIAKKQ